MRRYFLLISILATLFVGVGTHAEPAQHVVISEVQLSGGTGYSTNEFVELYNPTDLPIALAGWKLAKQTATGSEYNLIDSIGNVTIAGHSFFLLAHPVGYRGTTQPDAYYSTTNSIADNNTVILYDNNAAVVDMVGFGTSQAFEGQTFANPAGGKSVERKARVDSTIEIMIEGGSDYFSGNSEDTDTNVLDFLLRTIPEPQNMASEPEYLTVRLITQPTTPSRDETVANEEPQPEHDTIAREAYDYSDTLVLSELFPAPVGKDEENEFIELYNPDNRTIHLAGWALTDTKRTYFLPANMVIAAKSFAVIERKQSKIVLNDGGDTLYLIDPADHIINGVEYDKAKADQTFARFDDGWAWTDVPTPGEENALPDEEIADQTGTPAVDTKATSLMIEDISEDYLGRLLVIEGTITQIRGDHIYLAGASGGTLRVYIQKSTSIEKPDMKAGDRLRVTGVLDKTSAGLRLLPRQQSDIEVLKPQGEILGADVVAAEQNTIVVSPSEQASRMRVYLMILAGMIGASLIGFLAWHQYKKRKQAE